MVATKFDYALLREKIQEKYGTIKNFSEAIGICTMSIWRKLNGKTDFTTSEVLSMSEMLEIKRCEIPIYFFNQVN